MKTLMQKPCGRKNIKNSEEEIMKYLELAQERGKEGLSAMYWHINLLYWLVKIQKPLTIVELGTGLGGSFLAMLQGIVENGSGHIYTIDVVDRTPYLQPAEQDKKYYSHIVGDVLSVPLIENIDLLLVDDYHKLEHVTKEWERWRGYVKVGGIIIFHDSLPRDSKGRVYAPSSPDGGTMEFLRILWNKEKDRFVRLFHYGAELNGDRTGLEIWVKIK